MAMAKSHLVSPSPTVGNSCSRPAVLSPQSHLPSTISKPDTRDTSGNIVIMGLHPVYQRFVANWIPFEVAGDDFFISGQSVYVFTPTLCFPRGPGR